MNVGLNIFETCKKTIPLREAHFPERAMLQEIA